MKKTVCLIGRPNVGKSTIFNKLIRENKSIIMDTPGVTRDRIYGNVNYDNYSFLLIDTGGIDLGEENFNKDIKVQAEIAIAESDVILFVVDGREDLTSNDLLVRDMLLKTSKKVIVVLNKLDNVKMQEKPLHFSFGIVSVKTVFPGTEVTRMVPPRRSSIKSFTRLSPSPRLTSPVS